MGRKNNEKSRSGNRNNSSHHRKSEQFEKQFDSLPRNSPGKGPQAFLERISKNKKDGKEESDKDTVSERRSGVDRRKPQPSVNDPYALPESSSWSLKNARKARRKKMRDENTWDEKKPGPRRHRDNTYNKKNRLKQGGSTETSAGVAVIQGEVQKNRKGFAFLLQRPEDIFIPPDFASALLSGDVVKVWYDRKRKEVLKLETVSRGVKAFIGTYMRQNSQHFVELRDRTMSELVQVGAPVKTDPKQSQIREGHKVMVEIVSFLPKLKGRIIEDYGPKLAPKFDTLAVVTRSQWPQEFSVEAQSEATEASLSIIQSATDALGKAGGRRDLRDRPFVTIDGKDARDFDDAVLVEKTKSGFVLYVAIADVAEFVKQGAPLDQEAFSRTTSVYFPDYVIPMLPEALSNGACSLKPREDRLVLVSEMHFDLSGKKRSTRVYEGIISSQRRCIYEEVEEEAKKGDPFWEAPYELYRILKKLRIERGTIDLDLPEAKIILNEAGETIDIRKADRLDAHRLIEEFMISANESVTETMEREGWPFVYRVHEPPQGEALERFSRFAQALGLRFEMKEEMTPKSMAKIMESILDHPLSSVLSYLLLRSLKQARYESVNAGHFGLASKAYTHFTSPIRRYPDLMVHRILKRFVHRKSYEGDELEDFRDYLFAACDHCSKFERKGDELARTVERVKKARFMANHLGEVFNARISNASNAGLYVELENWFIEGLVPIDEIGNDYFEFDDEKIMLFGKRTGRKFKIGDKLSVTVLRCDVDQGQIDFTLQSGSEKEEQ